MSKLAEGMRSQMGAMTEREFHDMLGLSKQEFIDHLDEMADAEARCVARPSAPAPGFSAPTLTKDGTPSRSLLTLEDLRGRPVALIFGCYTCPIFRRQTDRMQALIDAYGDRVTFLFVYVTEAHPIDGWNTPSNVAADVMYAQPTDLEDRSRIARAWRDAYAITAPIVLDFSDNRINADYAGSPERLYVMDADGLVTFQSDQGPYEDGHLEDWAAALAAVSDG